MNLKILQKGYEDWKDHRGDFETCPTCSHRRGHQLWEKWTHTICLEPQHSKSDSVMIISKCEKCGSDSWVHEPMHSFSRYGSDWPAKVKKVVQTHEAKVKLKALREWGRSLCWSCRNLTSGTVEYHVWRQCKYSCSSASGPVRRECEHYRKDKRCT